MYHVACHTPYHTPYTCTIHRTIHHTPYHTPCNMQHVPYSIHHVSCTIHHTIHHTIPYIIPYHTIPYTTYFTIHSYTLPYTPIHPLLSTPPIHFFRTEITDLVRIATHRRIHHQRHRLPPLRHLIPILIIRHHIKQRLHPRNHRRRRILMLAVRRRDRPRRPIKRKRRSHNFIAADGYFNFVLLRCLDGKLDFVLAGGDGGDGNAVGRFFGGERGGNDVAGNIL